MGTINFSLGKYAGLQGSSLMSSEPVASGSFATSAVAANLQDGGGDVVAPAGVVFRCIIDEPAWVAFGGGTATVGSDFYMSANIEYEWEIKTPGAISVIDVA